MLPKETKVVDDKRLLLNYFSNQVKNKVKNMMDDNYKDLWGHLLEVATDHKNATTKALSNWDNLIENLKKTEFEDHDDHADIRDTPPKLDATKVPEKPKGKPDDKSTTKTDKTTKQDQSIEEKKSEKKEEKKDEKKAIKEEKPDLSLVKQEPSIFKQEPVPTKQNANLDDLIFGHDIEKLGGAINNDNDLFDNIFESIDTNKIPKAESFT